MNAGLYCHADNVINYHSIEDALVFVAFERKQKYYLIRGSYLSGTI